MSIKKNIFENVIDIGLRMYGNGYSYPIDTVDYITEYCRQYIRYYFIKYNQLMIKNRISFLSTLVYISRDKKTCLKRLQQFIQAKDRSISQQNELVNKIKKNKKMTIINQFIRICRQIEIHINKNESMTSTLDHQRSRQYARLDDYYKSDTLTSDAYLSFIEQQNTSFNNLRLLSSNDILQWINLNDIILSKKSLSNQDLRLAEICLFLIKEILLNIMDKVYYSSYPCQIRDILRRQHVHNNRRLPFSRRKRIIIH